MFNRTKILWWLRVIEYGFNYFVLELPRGLDFSRRQRDTKTLNESSGYALTSKKALEAFIKVSGAEERRNFIDIGGGKGGTAYFANLLDFKKSTSLEYEQDLHKIACKNISKLKLEDKVNLINLDAFQYHIYYEYSHIFMFRPLNGELMHKLLLHVVNNINENKSKVQQPIVFLLYGGIEIEHIKDLLDKCDNLEIVHDDMCPFRNTNRRVLKWTL